MNCPKCGKILEPGAVICPNCGETVVENIAEDNGSSLKRSVVSEDVLRKLNPQVIIVGEAPSEFLNYYSGYNTITQNRAGDIVFDCDTNITHVFVGNKNYRTQTNFLINKSISDNKYGYYLGSFMTKRG